MKKILFISSWFPTKVDATTGIYVQRHAEAVATMHHVEILHAKSVKYQVQDYIFDEKIINGIRTILIYYRKSNNKIINVYRKFTAYEKGFKRVTKPDIIHANIMHYEMLFALYLKVVSRIPYVISEHWSLFLPENSAKISFLQKKLFKIIANKAAFVLPVSPLLEKSLKELKIGKKYKIIGNVVDTDIFKNVNSKNLECFTFLHLSSLIALKNPEVILNVALLLRSKYQNFKLEIGGDGDLSALKTTVSKHSAQDFVNVFSTLSAPAVANKMAACDCFVLYSDYETFGCVILESLSMGRPVISTKVGIAPTVIHSENGILINQSEAELYQAMEKILLNREVYNTEKMHQEVQSKFGKKYIAEEFSAIYDEINFKK